MSDSSFRTRLITGLILGGVVIGLILGGAFTSAVLVLVICIVTAWELYGMMVSSHAGLQSWIFALMIGAPVALHYFFPVSPGSIGGAGVFWDWIAVIAIPLLLGLYLLYSMAALPQLFAKRLQCASVAFLLITVPGIFALQLIDLTPIFLLGIFLLIWTNDVFAYLIGSRWGRTKLAPQISPGKTWEGVIGAALVTLMIAFFLSQYLDVFGWRDWLVNAGLVIVFGTLGDLQQSAIKRVSQVKDSGSLLPGHGGFLDRFDSFLGCLPWIGIYNLLV